MSLEKEWKYLHSERATEKFRSELGAGTSSENIQSIGADIAGNKQAAKEAAFVPKNKLFAEHSGDPNISRKRYFKK